MITLKSRWDELFQKEMSEEQRKSNWDAWKKSALKNGKSDMVKYWCNNNIECEGCKYRNKDWCELQGLPCSVNPILTIQHGMLGMACMGCGYDDGNPQKEFDFSNLPF